METKNTKASKFDERKKKYSISIIVPVYNEEVVLQEFHKRLIKAISTIPEKIEIIYIDDGSKDSSWSILNRLHSTHPNVGILGFSRNFGKEQAMSAGLHQASGDAIIVIDSDLQDPPELIPSMLEAWREGADVVNMHRISRQGETWLKRITAHIFYRVINMMSEVRIHEDVGDFRLLSRRAVDALNDMPENTRFMKGLFAWIGYKQVTLDYHRDPRAAGTSKWKYWKLWNFAIEGITGFSTVPLKIASYAGFTSSVLAFIYATYFIIKTLIKGEYVAGFPTLIVTVLFLGGLQLMALGILGEYISRLFIESKRRPLYLIDTYKPANDPTSNS
ncbi:MAG: glycosyltransferase family 2 protein [Hyphomicrobium sp.]